MDQEVRWEGINWFALAQDKDRWWALVSAGSIKCGEFLD